MGETQERERVLIHFSSRYFHCNPETIASQGNLMEVLDFFWSSIKTPLLIIGRRGRWEKGGEHMSEEHRCERETSIGCLSDASQLGPNPQPRRLVPWPGIEPWISVYGAMLQPTEPHQPGLEFLFCNKGYFSHYENYILVENTENYTKEN